MSSKGSKKNPTKTPVVKGQQTLHSFMSSPSCDTPTLSPSQDPKKCTPPSGPKNPSKKLNISNEEMDTSKESVPEENAENDNLNDLDHRLQLMEKRITESIKKSICEVISIKLQPIEKDIKALTVTSQHYNSTVTEVKQLKLENMDLRQKYTALQEDNQALCNRLNKIEDKLLEDNVIITGAPEDAWETESTLYEKVYQLIAYTVDAQDSQLQLDKARKAKIHNVKRLGSFSKFRGHPISVNFEKKSEAKYFMENKGYLPDGIRVKREFCSETEQERRILRPVMNAAKRNPDYRGKCRWDGSSLVIKGKTYTSHNIGELPSDLNGYKVSS